MGFVDFLKKIIWQCAKDRLKLVLVSDRTDCSPGVNEASEK